MDELSPTERRALRAAAHHLHPTASIAGNGLSPAVLKEIDSTLRAHALIKIKLHGIEGADRDTLLSTLCTELDCAPVQRIGNILILWRPKPEEEKTAGKTPRRRRISPPRTKKQAAAALDRKTRKR